jgi:HlyD family secretion protein
MKAALAILLLLMLAVGVWQLLEWRNRPPEIPFTRATRETISSIVSTNGKVEPIESGQARAETAGRVDRILVHLRQQVRAGQPLVELDTAQLRHDLEAAQARIAAIQYDLSILDAGGRQPEKVALQTQIDAATVELAAARAEYEKEVRLEAQGASTRQAVTDRKNRVESLEAHLRGLERRLGALIEPADRGPLEARLRQEEAARQQILIRIQQSTVRAPISGTIYEFDLKPGAYLNPGQLVASIGRLDRVRVAVYVDEPDLGRIRTGLPVSITWDAIPGREWTGTVDRLPAQIEPLGSRQVGEVLCIIDNPDGGLLPNTNITARIRTEVVENAITIPKEAIFRDRGQTGVYFLVNDHIEWRPVTLGVNNVARAEVKDLQEGDIIALPSDRNLTSGLRVRPILQ